MKKVFIQHRSGSSSHGEIRFRRPTMTIGSSPRCDLRLDSPTAEPVEASVEFVGRGQVRLSPVGRPSDRRILNIGDEFWIDAHHFRVMVDTQSPTPQRKDSPPLPVVHRFGLVAQTRAMYAVFEQIESCASSMEPVMVLGESGTGKESSARALHDCSDRIDKPFVAINCGALTPSLVESELFGHTKGAFTGADSDRKGAFASADGGTLFLDEIGELDLSLQPKLLRTLEAKTVRPVGASEEIAVDVRIVTATHRNLRAMVQARKFREDLFHRLLVFSIAVPPLRERREEIPALVRYILDREFGSPKREIEDDALEQLVHHDWPGNVRELRNVLVRAGHGRDIIDSTSVDLGLGLSPPPIYRAPHNPPSLERKTYLEALRNCGGNRSMAARWLQVSKSTFYDRVRRLGLESYAAEASTEEEW